MSQRTVCFLISCVIFLAFSPCLNADFINFDDPVHFLQNKAVLGLSFQHLRAIFTQTVNGIYIPLTTLTFAAEHYFFGFNKFIFHLVNVLLHLVNVILVLLLAKRMGLSLKAAALAALIFGIHPMKVESVAWVTELKDVLYALFYLLALHQYWSYLKTKATGAYLGSFFWGFASMAAKPMALSLPFILLLIDWFQGRRWDKNILLEKIPFFFYIAELGSLTYLFHMRNPISQVAQGVWIWVWSFNFYICKFFFPYHVSFIYTLPNPPTIWSYASTIGIFILIIGALIYWRKYRLLMFAFGYYFLSIFFLLRFDDRVDFTIVSDRFMYLPALGFCLLLGVWLERLLKPNKIFFIIILIFLLGVRTFQQCGLWHDSFTLWNEVVREYPQAASAYYGRGTAFDVSGHYKSALNDFSKAIQLDPLYSDAFFMRSSDYYYLGQGKAALEDINRAIRLDPSNLKLYSFRAMIEEKNNDLSSAIKDYSYVQRLSGASFAGSINRLKKGGSAGHNEY